MALKPLLNVKFQSTLPARGSDPMVKNIFYVFRYFNPRSPQGGATMPYFKESLYIDISIHAPRKGERLPASLALLMLPVISIHAPRKGERQDGFRRRLPFVRISIHAPRKGERPSAEGALLHRGKISIHAPRKGERLTSCCSNFTLISSFQSTLPARGSDMLDPDWPGWEDVFQSTLPARGSDHAPSCPLRRCTYFNPRSPQGGAT